MTTIDIWRREEHSAAEHPRRAMPAAGNSYRLSAALAAVSALAALLTYFIPGVLSGPAAMNGSARGTALVVFGVAVPLLVGSMWAASRGSVRAVVAWLGAIAYLLYNAVMFLFATPFNQLFLLYVAMLCLVIWAVIAVLRQLDLDLVRGSAMPARGLAAYIWVVVTLNAVAWLAGIVPALFAPAPAGFLDGTGLATNPVYVQDLAFWLPLAAVAGWWLWQRRPWGFLIAGSVLTMWVLESISIAVDQWYGHTADPSSPVAAAGMAAVFAAVAAIGCVPVYFFYRRLGK
jgi:hypothetical protein